ncbi:MAG: DUF87 domain-containing protein [Lachnospiraceae bacterium]|nr:DUF87 domain-containing protein [Lachnospiraceae bacterium]
MALIETTEMQFKGLKKEHRLWKVNPESVQDTLEIRRISPCGIFENGRDLYSKTLEIKDVNYNTKSYPEQVVFVDGWNHVLDSFKIPFKLTIFNQRRNEEKMRKNILYPLKGDLYDEARECYNDIMQQKILVEKQGVEQHKYITLLLDKKAKYQDIEKTMRAIESRCIKEFAEIGSEAVPLSGNERLQLLHDFYQPGQEHEKVDIEELMENGWDWRNEIIYQPIDFQPRQVVFGEKFARALYIEPHSYGGELEDTFLHDLSSLTACSVFSVDYVPVDKKLTKKVLEAKYMGIEHMISKQTQKRVQQKNFVSEISYRAQAEKDEIKEMLDMVRKNGQRFFWVGVTMVVVADSLEELDELTTSLEQTCDSAGCKLCIALDEQRKCFNTALPVGVRNFAQMRAMFTQSAAGFIPFATMELMEEENPFYYGVNKLSRNPILANRKKLMNPHGFVFGKTGSGKSFNGAKMEVGSIFLTTDDHIIAIDPQNEYKDPCRAFNGIYIDLGESQGNHINPLHCSLDDFDKKKLYKVIKEKQALMNSIAEHSLDKSAMNGVKTIVDRCVRILFERIADLPAGERYVPLMKDFYQVVQEETEKERRNGNLIGASAAETLELCMERFVSGALDMFNHPTNVDMENRMLVFGIKDMDESYWGIAMAILLSLIRGRIMQNYEKGITTWFYSDEFHYMLKTKYTAEYMIEFWKTMRKFRAILTGLTQNAIDALQDGKIATLISNSEYAMFLKCEPEDIKVIAAAFEGISGAQLEILKTAPKGVGVVRFGDAVISMDNVIDKNNPIYDVFNTNPYEKSA